MLWRASEPVFEAMSFTTGEEHSRSIYMMIELEYMQVEDMRRNDGGRCVWLRARMCVSSWVGRNDVWHVRLKWHVAEVLHSKRDFKARRTKAAQDITAKKVWIKFIFKDLRMCSYPAHVIKALFKLSQFNRNSWLLRYIALLCLARCLQLGHSLLTTSAPFTQRPHHNHVALMSKSLSFQLLS